MTVLVIVISVLSGRLAFAQEAPALRAHQVTLGASLVWARGYDIGDATAQLRGNTTGPTAPAFGWFTAESRVGQAIAPALHVGFAFTPTMAIEGGIAFARPRVAVAISGDAEAASQELPGEQVDQYEIGAGLTWQLPIGLGRKSAPFVTLGGAYLRQLHEDRALAETGQVYYAGGGARYWLAGGHGATTAVGVRADGRINLRKDGIDFENKMRTYPSLTLSLFVGF